MKRASFPGPARPSWPLGLGLGIAVVLAAPARAKDWPQWCGSDGKNMVSDEKGLPDSFVPGKKLPNGWIDPATARGVKWGVKLGDALYSTPSISGGKVFVGGVQSQDGIFACLDEATGKLLWQWRAPPRKVPASIGGFSIGISGIPAQMGVCSSAAVEGQRVYFVSNRFEVLCLDAAARPPDPEAGKPRVVWSLDMFDKLGVFPCDAANGSPLVDGDLVYVQTSNGVDRNTFADASKEKNRKFPAPAAPNLIVLDKHSGRLVATDGTRISDRLLHGQWSSPALGRVGDRKLVFFGGGDGRCYAFEALGAVPREPVRLKTVWSCDCIPPEYKRTDGLDWITRYCLGDKRVKNTWNKHDGNFVGESEIVATPVFVANRIYVAIGRDPEHGRGRGALYAIDATQSGDITRTGKLWTYQGLDRTLSTASVAGGLVYVSDVGGRLHCLDAETGHCYWIHDTQCQVWGSTLVADGKVYMPTPKGLWVLSAGKELRVLDKINLGAKVLASPVVANGTLYVAVTNGWLYAVGRRN
ncbi:MAG: PQQ-binding-like beta-propeller repeat protein [Thermoguttaceae bacterium]|jgi:outer membrane protein assembly factor BamB